MAWSDAAASAGDINGDGFDDLMIGDYSQFPPNAYVGTTFVVLGKATGFPAYLNPYAGGSAFRINGAQFGDLVGVAVSSAGDVDGDGFDDMLIGGAGSAYVVFGKASAFTDMSIASLDGNNGFQLESANGFNFRDLSVSSAGDINGDGFADMLIGATDGTYVVF